MAKKKQSKSNHPTHPRKGLIYALAVIPLGIAAWLFLWEYGFIASLVAWGIAGGAVWFYKLGSKGEVTRAVAPWLIAIIFVGILLAFASGLISDLWHFYVDDIKEIGETASFWSNEFWTNVWDNLTYWDFVSQYWLDFLLSLVFAALGAGSIVYGLFKQKKA